MRIGYDDCLGWRTIIDNPDISRITKHIFAGQTRIASVVNASGSQGVRTGRGQPDSGLLSGLPGGGSNAGNDRAQQALRDPAFGHPGQGRANRSETAEQRSSNVEQNPNLTPEDGSTDSTSTSTNDGTTTAAPNRNRPTRFRYYYHTDHLGSTNYVTDSSGVLYEHLQYFPFGEQWVDQRRDSGRRRIDHRFTGKEYDEETGLYYFGARYYDPRTSVWQSPDPVIEDYLPMYKNGRQVKGKNGGVFDPSNLGLYSYAGNNPVIVFDPDGRAKAFSKTIEGHTYNVYGLSSTDVCGGSSACKSDLQTNPQYKGLHATTYKGKTYYLNKSQKQNADYISKKQEQAGEMVSLLISAAQILPPVFMDAQIAEAVGDISAMISSPDKVEQGIETAIPSAGGRAARRASKAAGTSKKGERSSQAAGEASSSGLVDWFQSMLGGDSGGSSDP